MIAKVFLLCAAVASARATGFYNSPLLAPAVYNSGVYAPGLLNSVVAPGLLSAALPSTYATKTVVSAPAAVSYAAPVATAYTSKSVVAAPAAISYAAPALSYAAAPVATTYTTKSVVGAAPIAYAAPKTVIGATSLLTGTPLVYNNGLLANRLVSAAAPLAYSGGLYKGSPYLAGPGVVKTILK